MNPTLLNARGNPLAGLRRLALTPSNQERCELCCVPLARVHRHLLEMPARRILCTCDACGLRFQNVVAGRFKLIPRDTRRLAGFSITDGQWESLALPINLAFFFISTSAGKTVAMYPSPAGATESLLPLENWRLIAAANRWLNRLEPDVEALLVNRTEAARDYFIAPIDRCYELVGLIRVHWHGLAGGEKVWQEIGSYFAKLRLEAFVPQAVEVDHA